MSKKDLALFGGVGIAVTLSLFLYLILKYGLAISIIAGLIVGTTIAFFLYKR